MDQTLSDNIDEVIVDPKTYGDEHSYHRAFSWLRENDPVHWTAPDRYRPFWAVTRHADIMAVEIDAKNFLNDPRQFLVTAADEDLLFEQTGSRKFADNLVAMDDPKHRAYRALTSAWFGAKSLKNLEDEIAALARETVDRMIDMGGACDFAADVAAWFPLRTIMIVLGVPREDEPLMLQLSQKLFGAVGGVEGMAGMVDAFNAFNAYFTGITADRRASPRNDVATILATATIDGAPIGEAERNAYYLIVAAAGHDTTSSSISGGLLALIQNPAEMAKLRADPSLIGKAVDEFIRWTTPVKHFFRTAVSDCEVGGQRVRAGDNLMMCYPSRQSRRGGVRSAVRVPGRSPRCAKASGVRLWSAHLPGQCAGEAGNPHPLRGNAGADRRLPAGGRAEMGRSELRLRAHVAADPLPGRSGMTPARKLAERFGDVVAMRALYAPDVRWRISASLGVPPLEGRDAVSAFNRQVWTEHHRPDCVVTILDEAGGRRDERGAVHLPRLVPLRRGLV
ncbi:cytochrome P450, partial [Sphingomonas adhaesiva]|uniref:cytochrome P450 n=1 Tax=Sphingomonas adhaesiva TaxID=28212 RepID=UPI002FFBA25C